MIVNYDILKKHLDRLVTFDWAGMVFDEAHYLKNHTSQRSKYARQIVGAATDLPAQTGRAAGGLLRRSSGPLPWIQSESPSSWVGRLPELVALGDRCRTPRRGLLVRIPLGRCRPWNSLPAPVPSRCEERSAPWGRGEERHPAGAGAGSIPGLAARRPGPQDSQRNIRRDRLVGWAG